MRRLPVLAMCVVTLGLTAPGAAAGDGGPVPPQQGGAGVSTPDGDVAYIAVYAGRGRTVIERLRRSTGAVERSRVLHGGYGVGTIAFDGSATGLSADGRTLVLAGTVMRYPPRSTPLLVLDTKTMRTRRAFSLPGYYALDAISPDGRLLYVIHYMSPARNALNYEVRAYDLRARRMIAKPVVDPREPDEKMQGIAVTRTPSADGRWAYTMYIRPAGGEPFIHALDTVGRTARCIDLPEELGAGDVSQIRLTLGGGALTVVNGGTPAATVDLSSFKVRSADAPRAAAVPAPRPRPAERREGGSGDGGGAWPWALTALPLLGFAVVLVAERRRRSRRRVGVLAP